MSTDLGFKNINIMPVSDKLDIDKAVDFLSSLTKDKKTIDVQFFGGEPLMFIDLMNYTKDKVETKFKDTDKKISYNLSTNGTILNKKVDKFMTDAKPMFAISIDGPEDYHDKYRYLPNKSGSYKILSKHVETFLSYNPNILVQATVSKGMLDLVKIFEHLKSLGFKNINIMPVSDKLDKPHMLNKADFEQLKLNINKLADAYYDHVLNSDNPVILYNFSKPFKHILLKQKQKYYCSFGNNRLTVSAKGKIYPCDRFVEEEKFEIGDVHKGTFDQSKIDKLDHDLHVDNRASCSTCFAKHFCGGGCYHQAYITSGDHLTPLEMHCDFVRHFTAVAMDLLLRLYQDAPDKLMKIALRKEADIARFVNINKILKGEYIAH